MKKAALIFVAFLLFIVSVGAGELIFRWRADQSKPIETRACRDGSQEFHHVLMGETVCRSRYREWDTTFAVNHQGFRDLDVEIPKPDDQFRILLLGDSFIEGESVEVYETASWRLEALLQQEIGRDVDVINMGVMSYSAIQYARLLEKWTDTLEPNLVIVAIDMSDFQNDYSYSLDLDEEGRFRNILFQQQMGEPHVVLPGISSTLKFWLRTRSVFYATFADFVKSEIRRIRRLPEPTVFAVNDPKSDPHYATRSEENAKNSLMWDQFGMSMLRIRDLLAAKDIPWVAVIYPYGHQAAPDEWAVGREKNGFKRGIVYPSTTADLLVDFGKGYGFSVANLVSAFQRAATDSDEFLYWPYDGHFTPKGHEVMAEELKTVVLNMMN